MPSWAVWQAPDSSGVSQPGAPNKSMLHSHVQTRTSPPLQANSGPKFSGNISVSFSQIVGVTRIQEAPRKKAVIRRAVREHEGQSRGSASTAERKACKSRRGRSRYRFPVNVYLAPCGSGTQTRHKKTEPDLAASSDLDF